MKPIAFISIFVAIIFLISCQDDKKSALIQQTPVENVILVTIDTLRADHLGSYGYIRDTSPFIDSLAEKGVLFSNAFASCPTTSPSHASIFTSLYPIQHNVLKNGYKLHDSYFTMAEFFKQKGFKTAAFVSVSFLKPANFSQGFDVFNDGIVKADPAAVKEAENADEVKEPEEAQEPEEAKEAEEPEDPSKTKKATRYRLANKTIDAALEWLTQSRVNNKVFLWIHLYDPHPPHYSQSLASNYENQSEEMQDKFAKYLVEEYRVDSDSLYKHKARRIRDINSYDAEILYADQQLKRLHDDVNQKRLKSNTLWILTSDHGEGLWNHKYRGHTKQLYNEQLRVPLILYSSAGMFKQAKIEPNVELVDIFPTLTELMGQKLTTKNPQGTSLLSLIAKGKSSNKGYLFAQRQMSVVRHKRAKNHKMDEKYALQDQSYKYIFSSIDPHEFYDLEEDPFELNNLILKDISRKEDMKKLLQTKVNALKKEAVAPAEEILDNDELRNLKALGYVQ